MAIAIEVVNRKRTGRGGARDLRRTGMVPAIVYGGGEPTPIACSAREMMIQLQDESFRSTVITLNIDNRPTKVLLREVQMHPYRHEILHMDFQAVSEDSEIAANIPLHFVNVEEAPGIKLHRGIFTSIENQVAVHCLPKDLPEFINVDAGGLDISQNIHLSDITPPPGVRFDAIVRGEDPALAIVTEPKNEVETELTPEADAPDSPAATAKE